MLTFVAVAVAVLLVHALIEWRTKAPFHVAFRVTRGVASIVLTAVGFFALVHWSSLWRDAWLVRQDEPLATALVMIPLGHFAADFLLLGWGWATRGSVPRMDLVIHHALGSFAGFVVLHYGIS